MKTVIKTQVKVELNGFAAQVRVIEKNMIMLSFVFAIVLVHNIFYD